MLDSRIYERSCASIHLHRSLFDDLVQLRRLFLHECNFEDTESDLLKSLVNLEVLVIESPNKSSHIRLDSLKKLKWLKLDSLNDKPMFENLCNDNLEILIIDFLNNIYQEFKYYFDSESEESKIKKIRNMKLPKLKAFNLKNILNEFNLDWLSEAPNLINLDISKCRIRTFKCGKLVNKIEVLNLSSLIA